MSNFLSEVEDNQTFTYEPKPSRIGCSTQRFSIRKLNYFCRMAHDSSHEHGHHGEPEQNEIGGPVVFALILLGLLVTVITFLA